MVGFLDFLPSFGRSKSDFTATLLPDQPFVAIGDVHGCDGELKELLNQIQEVTPERPLVFVGDYVDRGPASAAVLRRIMKMCQDDGQEVFALKGNHEAMLLDFVEMPEKAGPLWLVNGGEQTLESFGVVPPADYRDATMLRETCDEFVDRAGEELLDWLRRLPLVWQTGNVVVTHAGADPSCPIEPRRGHGLLWGHPDFLRKERNDGLWIVHGHFIVSEPEIRGGRIAIDTGAFASGRLSAAIVEPVGVRFLST